MLRGSSAALCLVLALSTRAASAQPRVPSTPGSASAIAAVVLALSTRAASAQPVPSTPGSASAIAAEKAMDARLGLDPDEIDMTHYYFEGAKPQHQYDLDDYLRMHKNLWKASERDLERIKPAVQQEYAEWHRKKKAEHEQRMKDHEPIELLRTFVAYLWLEMTWLCLLLFLCCGCCGVRCARSVVRDKRARRYDGDGEQQRSPFRRSPVKVRKVD